MKIIKRSTSAFSLIEITIAMAIVAVAVVTLLGMLPRGMQTMQRAGDEAIFGRINQQILSELQLASWEDQTGASSFGDFDTDRVYDSQGIELKDGDDERRQVYAVRVHLPELDGTGDSRPKVLGGGDFTPVRISDESDADVKYIRRVVVEMAATSIADFDFEDEVNFPSIEVFQTTLSKLDKDIKSAVAP